MSKPSATTEDDLAKTIHKLSLTPPKALTRAAAAKQREDVAESWEDEASDNEDTPAHASGTITSGRQSVGPPDDPPPTPASPSAFSAREAAFQPLGAALEGPRIGKDGAPERRPEKSTAVASRLIAAGLGVRAPKRTEEQREYDRALKIQEKKKRDREREEVARKKEESEKAKAAIWED